MEFFFKFIYLSDTILRATQVKKMTRARRVRRRRWKNVDARIASITFRVDKCHLRETVAVVVGDVIRTATQRGETPETRQRNAPLCGERAVALMTPWIKIYMWVSGCAIDRLIDRYIED